ncbi:hypothetical protein FRC05_002615 [Tulasnella sp. 425]|nr:hypothetical protein FRC05_002615 [Tulasnella sp. 425]
MITAAQLRPEEPLLVPPITHPVFNEQADQKDVDMIWLIAAVFRLAAYRALTFHEIFELVKKHQPWRIDESRGPKRGVAAKRNIQFILTSSPAFDHDRAGHWYMTGMPLVRTKSMLRKLLKRSTRAVTHEENQAYCDWVDYLFAPVPQN